MGQAKQRGTYEQRVSQAQERDATVIAAVHHKDAPESLNKQLMRDGKRKFVNRIMVCGLFPAILNAPWKEKE